MVTISHGDDMISFGAGVTDSDVYTLICIRDYMV